MYYNMNKKLIRLTESDLHRIIKETINKVLNEGDGSYKGVYIEGLGLPERVAMSKIDACLKKGWSIDKIQRAVDDWAYQNKEDYKYKW